MSYYLLKETVQPCSKADLLESKAVQYAAILKHKLIVGRNIKPQICR